MSRTFYSIIERREDPSLALGPGGAAPGGGFNGSSRPDALGMLSPTLSGDGGGDPDRRLFDRLNPSQLRWPREESRPALAHWDMPKALRALRSCGVARKARRKQLARWRGTHSHRTNPSRSSQSTLADSSIKREPSNARTSRSAALISGFHRRALMISAARCDAAARITRAMCGRPALHQPRYQLDVGGFKGSCPAFSRARRGAG